MLDARGRKPVLLSGFFVFAIAGALYHLPQSPEPLFPIRIMNGLAVALVMTGASTYVADVAPADRRGRVMSYFGLANSFAFAAGPALGGYIINSSQLRGFDGFFTSRAGWLGGAQGDEYNFTTMFLVASTVGLVLGLAGLLLPEPKRTQERPRIEIATLFSKYSLLPGAVNMLGSFVFAAMVTFMPLFARDEGVENPGTLFVVYAAGVVIMQLSIVHIIDKVPRGAVVMPGLALLACSMVIFALSAGEATYFVAAGLYGLGAGAYQTALMAFTVDRAPAKERGRAMGTYTLGSDMGLSMGAVALGFIVQQAGFSTGFAVAACSATVALALFVVAQVRAGPGPANQTSS